MITLYEPVTIMADKKHNCFNRKVAVQEKYKKDTEINMNKNKRPFLLARKWQNDYFFEKSDMYGKENLIIKALKNNEKIPKKIIEKITDKRKLIDVADLNKHKNLKDKTIFVYVEKYSDNIYTVREDRYRDSQVIDKLYSEQFFGIAGEFVIINFDKINDKYHFKYVTSSFNYWQYKSKK